MQEQFPLRPAAAKTAHRCQGSTMASAVVDLSDRPFPHSHYVALNRVTSINNLFVRELNEKKISVCEEVTKEMNRLAVDRPLQLCQKCLYDGHSKFKLLFENVRSLNKHFLDIAADPTTVHLI